MLCDKKRCYLIPYAEVYPMNGSWSYLCKKHYRQEFAKYGNKYGWYELTLLERIRALLNWW